MPRQARTRSITGIYHIMLRGIDKREIFLEENDKAKFLECVIKSKEAASFAIYGYCLMDNHIHMLIKEIEEEVGVSVKRITVRYVGWHNKKYDRVGHLFQNRYRSEPVEDESYLLTVLRYIHQNPIKAKMCDKTEEYRWSSYGQYYYSYNGKDTIIDTDLVKHYFNSYENFSKFMNTESNDEFLEKETVKAYSDKDLRELIHDKYDIINLNELTKYEKYKILKEVYYSKCTSIRQLSRIFGIGKGIIERAVKSQY